MPGGVVVVKCVSARKFVMDQSLGNKPEEADPAEQLLEQLIRLGGPADLSEPDGFFQLPEETAEKEAQEQARLDALCDDWARGEKELRRWRSTEAKRVWRARKRAARLRQAATRASEQAG